MSPVRRSRGTGSARPRRSHEEIAMIRRLLHHPLVWSPVLAAATQLVLASAVAAVTGGGDFPVRR